MGLSVITLGLMGFLHHSLGTPPHSTTHTFPRLKSSYPVLDKPGSGLLPRWVRLAFRIIVGIFFMAFPAYPIESSFEQLGIYTGTMFGLVIAETIGKHGTRGNEVDRVEEEGEDDGEGGLVRKSSAHFKKGNKHWRRSHLTAYEKGEEDVGGQSRLGKVKAVAVRRGQREFFYFLFPSCFSFDLLIIFSREIFQVWALALSNPPIQFSIVLCKCATPAQ